VFSCVHYLYLGLLFRCGRGAFHVELSLVYAALLTVVWSVLTTSWVLLVVYACYSIVLEYDVIGVSEYRV